MVYKNEEKKYYRLKTTYTLYYYSPNPYDKHWKFMCQATQTEIKNKLADFTVSSAQIPQQMTSWPQNSLALSSN